MIAPQTMLLRGYVKRLLTAREESLELAQVHLTNATGKMKKWAEKERRETHFKVGDIVFLKMSRDQFPPPKGTTKSLTRKYKGSFKVK